jgi:hypothetical protein
VATRFALVLVALATLAGAGCSTLLSAEPTPIPGAAATLTRSVRTPIPTPERTPGASPGPSPGPARTSASPSASPRAGQEFNEEEIAQLQRRMEQTVGSPGLPGVETFLLDHVSLSTAQGGTIMDSGEAATWLRDRAGSGIRISRVDRGTQSLMLQVLTTGWPLRAPLEQGVVTFSLRRYDANGRLDDENGGWKVDVIGVE